MVVPTKTSSGNLFNSAFVIQNKKIKARYDKHLLPNRDIFDEKRYFSPGKESIFFAIKNVSFQLSICADLWHNTFFDQDQQYKKDPLISSKSSDWLINISASPFSHKEKLSPVFKK